MTLNDALLEKLIGYYQANGINVQQIVNNREFQGLPLDQKVKYLARYKDQFSAAPKFNSSSILPATLIGAASGAGSLLAASLKNGVKALPTSYMVAGGIGAAIGAAMSGLAAQKNFKQDLSIRNQVASNRYLEALINSSMHTSPAAHTPPSLAGVTQESTNNVLITHAREYAEDLAKYKAYYENQANNQAPGQ